MGQFTTSDISLVSQNGSHINLDLMSDNVDAKAQNGASISLEGGVKYLKAYAANSAFFNATNAEINTTDINLANSASAIMNVDTIKNAKLVNSSNLKYVGQTHLENVETLNSSSIGKK